MTYKHKEGDLLEISMRHHYSGGVTTGHGIKMGTVVEVVRASVFKTDETGYIAEYNDKPSYICRVFSETDEKEILEDELCIPN